MNNSLSRRGFLKGAGVLSVAAVLQANPGARLVNAQSAATYDIVDLGAWTVAVTDGPSVIGPGAIQDINQDGMVCGAIGVSAERGSPATWSKSGKLKRLKSAKNGGIAYGLNNNGDVVGLEYAGVDFGSARPMLWKGGERIELPLIDDLPEMTNGRALAVSDAGVIVGTIANAEGLGNRAVRWIDNVAELLPDPGDRQAATATVISQNGTILGGLQSNEGEAPGVVMWKGDSATLLPMPDIVTPEVRLASRALLNNDAVLMSALDSDAFLWFSFVIDGDEVTVIDERESGRSCAATDMNEDGLIVGQTNGPNDDHPWIGVLWRDGEATDLNELIPADAGLHIDLAWAINNAGMIACRSVDADDVVHGVLLVPRS